MPQFVRHNLPSRGLTDDVLTLLPRARSLRAYLRDGLDQLAGADPGLTQLRLAVQAVLGIGVGVGFAYGLVKATGALQLPAEAGPAAIVRAGDHALLIVAMLISAMVAMMAGLTVTDQTARGQILSTLFLPIPMLASMAIGIALGPYRTLSLIWLVILLSIAVYVRRFGPRGFAAGLVMFNGGFLGFFLHAELHVRDIGWIAALLGVGVLASLIVRFALFRPSLIRTLERMRRSWSARANRLLMLSIAVIEADNASTRDASQVRLRRQQVRLNECTLMIDAQLVDAVPESAGRQAQRLFDAELAISNIARFAAVLGERCRSESMRAEARACISAVLRGDADEVVAHAANLRASGCDDPRITVVAHRLAGSTVNYLNARRELDAGIERVEAEPDGFRPAVELNSGWLPGSGPVSTEASTTRGRGGVLDQATLQPYVRATIQVAVAGSIAIIVGDLVSGHRLYWAVVATFLAFMATTNSGEQVRKALFRVGGTAVGIIVGDLLVHLTGGHVWSSLLIVMVAMFLGIYLIRVNYTFMAIGITVTLAQLYAQLAEFSWHLLLLRLGETGIGVGAVILTVLLVVPLRPQRVLTTGVLLWFRSLTALTTTAFDRMFGNEQTSLLPEIRDLDAAYAALESTAAPLRQTTFGRNSTQLADIRSISSAARNYARSFANGVQIAHVPVNDDLRRATDQLRASMAAIENRIETGNHGTYTRSAALVEIAARTMPSEYARAQLTMRDLMLLDGALARLATALQMAIVDFDTTQPEPVRPEADADPSGSVPAEESAA